VAVIKSLFNEGAVFLAALNMGTGGQGGTRNHMTRIAVASERARLGLVYWNFSCPTRWSSSAVMTHRYCNWIQPSLRAAAPPSDGALDREFGP
jgi:hypothetical protein